MYRSGIDSVLERSFAAAARLARTGWCWAKLPLLLLERSQLVRWEALSE